MEETGKKRAAVKKDRPGHDAVLSRSDYEAATLKTDPALSIIRAENLMKTYNRRTVVHGVSFEIRQKEIVGLLGPNGAGKTTSFYMAVGIVKPDSGRVFINNDEITDMPMYKRARKGIGYLAQEASIFKKLTVRENIELVLEMHHKDRRFITDKRDSLLEELHLTKVINQKGFTLSGGERRRCEIARALATDPDFILLDEPFAGVDPIAVKDIQSLIAQLRTRGLGILITDHNVRETLKITDRSYIMYSGEILKSGTAQELVSDARIREIYLGDDFSL